MFAEGRIIISGSKRMRMKWARNGCAGDLGAGGAELDEERAAFGGNGISGRISLRFQSFKVSKFQGFMVSKFKVGSLASDV